MAPGPRGPVIASARQTFATHMPKHRPAIPIHFYVEGASAMTDRFVLKTAVAYTNFLRTPMICKSRPATDQQATNNPIAADFPLKTMYYFKTMPILMPCRTLTSFT